MNTAVRSDVLGGKPIESGSIPCAGTRGQASQIFHQGMILDGKYRLLESVCSSGRAHVYRAENTVVGWEVALKVLEPLSRSDEVEFAQRFERLSEVAKRINHPNVAKTYDFGFVDGFAYLITEFVQGSSLRTLISEQAPLPLPCVLSVASELCNAVSAAHALGLLHGDLKPEDILVTNRDGRDTVKVVDFGLSNILCGYRSNLTFMTKTGGTVGSPAYMSPELFSGKIPDARAEVYSLGVIIYEMLTGVAPFQSESAIDLLLGHLHESPKPLREVADCEVPEQVERVVMKALAKRPESRQHSALALLEELRESAGQPASGTAISREFQKGRVDESLHESRDEELPRSFRALRSGLREKLILLSVVAVCVLLLFFLVASEFEPGRLRFAAPVERENVEPSVSGAVSSNTGSVVSRRANSVSNFLPYTIPELGITVRALSPVLAEEFKLVDSSGLIVDEVQEGGRAAGAGLKKGDIIRKVETEGESILRWKPQSVVTPQGLENSVARAKERKSRLALVLRRGAAEGLIMFIDLPKGR